MLTRYKRASSALHALRFVRYSTLDEQRFFQNPTVFTGRAIIEDSKTDPDVLTRVWTELLNRKLVYTNILTTMLIACEQRDLAKEALAMWNSTPTDVALDAKGVSKLCFMCEKAHDAETARKLFTILTTQNIPYTNHIANYNRLLNTFLATNDVTTAMDVFNSAIQKQLTPDEYTFGNLYKYFAKTKDYRRAHIVFQHQRTSELPINRTSANMLISLFLRNKDIQKAEDVYRYMFNSCQPDAVTYTALFGGIEDECMYYAHGEALLKEFDSSDIQNKETDRIKLKHVILQMLVRCGIKEEAMKRYKEIQQDASAQSDLFYLVLLTTCSDARDFELGRRAYVDMQKQDLDSNLFLVNAILKFLTQSGDIKGARQVYTMMKNSSIMKVTNVTHLIVLGACQEAYHHEQDSQVYDFGVEVAQDALEDSGSANDERVLTQIVTMYFMFGLVDKAKQLYYERRKTFKSTSFSILLVECASTEHQDFGRDIFHDATQLGYQGLNLKNAMITMLFKIKKPQYAIDFFEQMIKQRISPDENTILAMLEGCVASEQVRYGYKVIDRMKSRVRWTLQLIIAVVKVYLANNDIHSIATLQLEEFHQFKNKQFYGTILTMLVDNGATEIADSLATDMKSSRFFDSVELGNVFMNVVASTSIRNAFELFQTKQKQDIHTYETILLHCARTASYDLGMTIYEMMRFESKPINTTIMSLVIDLAIKSGQFEEALLLEEKMIFMEPEPDENIYLTMMASCGDIGNQQLALQIQKLVVKRKEVSVNTFNGLIAMNGRCGLVDEAMSLFNVLKKNADSTTWSIIIHICSINNLADDALRYMEEMQQHGYSVTREIIIGVLNAYCKASKVVEALDIVKTMEEKYNIVPNVQIHNLVVETLCRAGHLQLAEQYINAMPERDHCTHTLYIEGLLKEGKVEKARKQLNALRLRRSETSQHDALWNMYAKEMIWDTVNQKLILSQSRSRKILPECAYVYIEKSEKLDSARCYAFTRHEEIEAKEKVVALLTDLLNVVHSEHGFLAFEMKDENAWRQELELLALGTALRFTPQGTNVTITTNLKIGWSRLEFMRLVSLVTKRNIRVRDANGWIEFSSLTLILKI